MTSALLTAAIILGTLCLLIIIFILLQRKGHNKKLARQLLVSTDVIRKNRLEIIEQEVINSYFLAIDKVNFALLYIDFSKEKEVVMLTDLWQVRAVKVTTDENVIYEQRKGKPVIIGKEVSKLHIEITFLDTRPKAQVVLYEYKDGVQNLVETKTTAARWCLQLDEAIQELPHSSSQKSNYA